MQAHVEEGVIRAGLACSIDSEESFAADADFIDEDLVYTTLAWWDGEGSWWDWRTSSRDTIAIVESVALNAITSFGFGIVDCKSFASTTIAIDIIESRNADACE